MLAQKNIINIKIDRDQVLNRRMIEDNYVMLFQEIVESFLNEDYKKRMLIDEALGKLKSIPTYVAPIPMAHLEGLTETEKAQIRRQSSLGIENGIMTNATHPDLGQKMGVTTPKSNHEVNHTSTDHESNIVVTSFVEANSLVEAAGFLQKSISHRKHFNICLLCVWLFASCYRR